MANVLKTDDKMVADQDRNLNALIVLAERATQELVAGSIQYKAGVVERDRKGQALPTKEQRLVYQVNYCERGRFPIGEEGR